VMDVLTLRGDGTFGGRQCRVDNFDRELPQQTGPAQEWSGRWKIYGVTLTFIVEKSSAATWPVGESTFESRGLYASILNIAPIKPPLQPGAPPLLIYRNYAATVADTGD